LLYLGYLIAEWVTAAMPRRVSHGLATLVADIWYAASPSLRRILDRNLALVPALRHEPGARARVARAAVRNFAGAVADFLYLPRIDLAGLERIVAIDEFRDIKQKMAGRPAILVTAHLGSWELAAAAAGLVGMDLKVVVWDHPDPRIARLFRRVRQEKGVGVMSVREAARTMPSVLETSCVGLAGDRDFTGQGVEVKFLGATTRVPSAYAALARSKGVPVIPVFCVLLEDGRYHLCFEPPITTAPGAPQVDEIVGTCLRAFEKYVEKYPEQWYRFELLTE
jgi:lauroyl/myristoyl acyltransferase